jgi:hypothetical protein
MPSNKSAMTEKEEHSSALCKISSVICSAMTEKEEHTLYKISLAQQRVIPHRLVAEELIH